VGNEKRRRTSAIKNKYGRNSKVKEQPCEGDSVAEERRSRVEESSDYYVLGREIWGRLAVKQPGRGARGMNPHLSTESRQLRVQRYSKALELSRLIPKAGGGGTRDKKRDRRCHVTYVRGG